MLQKHFLTYFPRHEYPVLPANDAFSRKLILDFKNGCRYAQNMFAEHCAQWLYETFGYDEMTNLIAVAVPSYNAHRMIDRFSAFFTDIHYYCGIDCEYINIYAIGNGEPSHIARGNGEECERMKVALYSNHRLKGKNVVIFDDITTTGYSLQETRRALEEAGANVVAAITLAKTVS